MWGGRVWGHPLLLLLPGLARPGPARPTVCHEVVGELGIKGSPANASAWPEKRAQNQYSCRQGGPTAGWWATSLTGPTRAHCAYIGKVPK